MAEVTTARRSSDATLVRIGGVAGVAGGSSWVAKSVLILATGDQPPLTYELALPLLGASLLGVAHLALPPGRRRGVVATSAWLAVVSGLVALGTELLGESWDPAIAAWALALLTGQLCLLKVRPTPAPLTFWTGASTVPVLLVGGALAEINDRLLELSIVCLGLAWMTIGFVTLRRQAAVRRTSSAAPDRTR